MHGGRPVSVSLQAVASALSWRRRPSELTASFSERTAEASAYMTFGAQDGDVESFIKLMVSRERRKASGG